MADAEAPQALTAGQAARTIASKQFVVLLVLVSVVGVVVSLAT